MTVEEIPPNRIKEVADRPEKKRGAGRIDRQPLRVPSSGQQSEKGNDDVGSIAIAGSPKKKRTKRKSLKKKAHSSRKKRRKKKQPALQPKKSVLLLLLVICLFLVAGSILGSFFLVPTLIKGVAAEKLSTKINRPVRIETAFFNPLTLTVRLNNIHIGPNPTVKSSHSLLHCDFMEYDFEAISIIKKGFICRRATVNGLKVNLVRNYDLSYNLTQLYRQLVTTSTRESSDNRRTPAFYFSINNITIDDSSLAFIDQPTGKTHNVKQIHFSLPALSNFPYQTGNYIRPEFSALINESPIKMTGKSRVLEDNSIETRLDLQLKDFDLVAYSEYLPLLPDKTTLTDGRIDGTVELGFSGFSGSGMKLTLRSVTDIHDLVLQDNAQQDIFQLPGGRLVIRAEPLTHRYIFENIQLNHPEVQARLDRQKKLSLAGWKIHLNTHAKNNGPEIRIDKLQVDQGVLLVHKYGKKKRELWRDVQLSLAGFTTTKTSTKADRRQKPAAFTLSGNTESATGTMSFSTKGTIDEARGLEGSLKIDNMNPVDYQTYLLADTEVAFTKGKVNLKGRFQYIPPATETDKGNPEKKQGLHLLDTQLSIRNLELTRAKKQLLIADELSCKQLTLDFAARNLACWRLDLRSGTLSGEQLLALKKQKNSWNMILHNLGVDEFTAHIPLPSPPDKGKKRPTVTLTKISLQAADLRQEKVDKNNIAFRAQLNSKATIQLDGRYSLLTGQGQLQTAAKNIDIDLLSPYIAPWFVPQINQGSLHTRGDLRLPATRFTGMVWIENFAAGQAEKPLISWQQAFASGVSFTARPFHLGISEVNITQPFLDLTFSDKYPTTDHSQPGALASFLHLPKQKNLPAGDVIINVSPIDIHTIRFEEGTFKFSSNRLAPGHTFTVSDITGTVKDIHKSAQNKISFALSGNLEQQGEVIIRGTGGIDTGILQSSLDVYDLSLTPFADALRKDPGLNVHEATVNISRQFAQNSATIRVTNKLEFSGIRGEDQGSFTDTLALLTDNEGRFRLQLDEEQEKSTTRNTDSLLNLVAKKMQRYQIKSTLSPFLLLKETRTEPVPAAEIHFTAGSDELDDRARQILENYRELLLKRPLLQLMMTSGFDRSADGDVFREQLQQKADEKRKAENKRRTEKRRVLLEKEKKRLMKAPKKTGKIVVEKIEPSIRVPDTLKPLPPVAVSVPETMLENLALRRSAKVIDYLVRAGIDENRLLMTKEVDEKKSDISFNLQGNRQSETSTSN